nr:DUF3160 domain-containing protein [Planctomycetota bacterium]
TYHVIFEEVLKALETSQAAAWGPRLTRLLEMLDALPRQPRSMDHGAIRLARGVVAVAARLLGEKAPVPDDLEKVVRAEVELITAAQGLAASPLRRVDEDYAQYKPRGLYEGDAALEGWFRAAQWLGRTAFRVVEDRETLAACLIAKVIQGDEALRKAFSRPADVYGWLLGPPDDLTVEEYIPVVRDMALPRDLKTIRMRLSSLRDPQINDQLLQPSEWIRFRARTKGLRLFPKRRTPDGWLAQELVLALPGRSLVGGLEVAASLGSNRAARHLSRDPAMPALGRALGEHEQSFLERLEGTHYGATLKAQALLFDETGALHGKAEAVQGAKGTPSMRAPIFRTSAWGDRLLTSALAGWASLKHAWVLHTKSSVYFLGMTDTHAGVVEPAARYYAALGELATSLDARMKAVGAYGGADPKKRARRLIEVFRKLAGGKRPSQADMSYLSGFGERLDRLIAELPEGDTGARLRAAAERLEAWLAGKGKLTETEHELLHAADSERLSEHLTDFAELMGELVAIVERQLAGKELTEEQNELLLNYGKRIAGLQFFGGNSWLSPSWQMGLVADIGSDPQRGLRRHVAVGAPMELYVVLPLHGGGHQLYVGGVYSYYEFDEPGPLTDSAWRKRVTARDVPPLPAWTSSHVPKPGVQTFVERIGAGEMPEAIRDIRDDRIAAALLERLQQAPLETPAHDKHFAWVAKAIARYGDSEQYPAIRDALIKRLLSAPGKDLRGFDSIRREELGRFARDGSGALGRILAASDRERIVGLIVQPPEGAHAGARGRFARALMATRHGGLVATAQSIMDAASPEARRWAVEIVAERYEYRDKGGPADVAGLLARHVGGEKDVSVQALMLQRLAEVARNEASREAAQSAAPVAAKLLRMGDERARRAAEVLGALHARRHVGDLLVALSSADRTDDSVMCPLLEGLGGALTGVEGALPDLDAKTLGRALGQLDAAVYSEEWHIAVSAMRGLAQIGSPRAAESIGRFATDGKRDPGLRNVAINFLGDVGKAAIPYLFRLVFDETETGSSINDHQLRICDEAGVELYKLTEGKFGWAWDPPDSAEERAKGLAKMRAEAKRRGLVR